MSSTSFHLILDAAIADYAKQTGIDPIKHPFADRLQTSHSPDDVLELLGDKASEFENYREGNRELIDCLKPVVAVVHTISGFLGGAVSLVPFQPVAAIFVGLDILLSAASGVSSSYDALVDLFNCVGNFLKRLRVYTNLPLDLSLKEICVKIMVELLSVLALATKQIKQGRFKKFAKKLLGESEIEAVLQRLDRLTQEEGRMTVAQTLEVVHCLMNNVKVVMDDGKVSMNGIWKALDTMQQVANDVNKMRRDQLRRDSRNWLSPPDPTINYNIACQIHQDGTSTWFFQGGIFAQWNAKGSLLWIHGKPGSGKSVLMSSIIQEIDRMCRAGLALMAYFFFDFRDTQKQHLRGLLSSLLFQLSAKSDACYHVFSRFYWNHDEGTRQPSEDALLRCLTEMLEVQGQPATYIIIDALDESPDISGIPTAREKVLQFLEHLVGLRLPNVYICLSSRPEIDIRTILEPLAPILVSLHEERGQIADILGYVKSVVHSDRNMRRWTAENKQLVVDTLSDKADGMFRWVYCQLEILRRCFPPSIRSALDGLPKSLDETYEHALLRIDEEKRPFAHRLFQCLAVAVRPLRGEELAEVLAVRLDEGALPRFSTGWRLPNADEAVLAACSSLITIVNVDGTLVVQFAHFSVKEFLTSDRLATANEDLSHYHIVPHLAHATLAQASLGVLLHFDDRTNKDIIKDFPLATYAARHWFEHCQFEDVSPIQDAAERLFDREKPHFSAWVWIYDIDDPWREPMPTEHPERPDATPLYYAILCGFRWLIKDLMATYPGDIDAQGGWHGTPLLAAFFKENIDVALSLLKRGADVNVLDDGGQTPLHRASATGHAEIVQLLLENHADVNILTPGRVAPLLLASAIGSLEIASLLVKKGANVNSRTSDNWAPLNVASDNGHLEVVRLLIDKGADVDSPNGKGRTPLHSAASNGNLDIVKLLTDSGADVNIRTGDGKTPLDLASDHGKLKVVEFLSKPIARATSLDGAINPPTPQLRNNTVQPLRRHEEGNHSDNERPSVYTASENGQLDILRSLLDCGADVDEKFSFRMTALHAASSKGELEVAKLLIERGAQVDARSRGGWTPLHSASRYGHLDIIRLLLDHGADVNAKSRDRGAALHYASVTGPLEAIQLLLERGADVDLQNVYGRTPRQEAIAHGHHRFAELLSGHETYEA